MRNVKHPPILLYIALLPIFLALSSVRWLALDLGTYQQGFARHEVSRATGLDSRELEAAGSQIILLVKRNPLGAANPASTL